MPNKSSYVAIAAALLLAAGLTLLSLFVVGAKPTRVEPRPAADKVPIQAAPDAAEASTEDPAPPEVLAAKKELRAEYAKQKQNMPEDVAKPIEDDIGVIEGVAADLLAAIANEPDNEDLKMMLIETYRNEMKLLKKALHLSSPDDENEDKDPATPTQ